MSTMLLISFIVFIVLPMICSALFLVARVCGVNHQVDALCGETANAQTIFATSSHTLAC